MKKLLKLIALSFVSICFFSCMDQPQLPEIYEIDLTEKVGNTCLSYNEWGKKEFSYFQNEGTEITNIFNNELPKKNDVLNLKWKGKSDTDIKKLHMLVADIEVFEDGSTKWTHLFPEDKILENPVAKNITADEEFEINLSFTLEANVIHSIWVFFSCGETDASNPVVLYTGTKPENYPPVLKIENETVKFTAPGEDYLDALKAKGCDGYYIGIASGKTPEGWDKWIFGKPVHLTDENALEDVDFTLDFASFYSDFEDGKIHAVLDFYKNVDLPEGKREWLAIVRSPEVTYTPNPELQAAKLEIENEIVKVTAPSEKYLEALKALGCDGYCIGIASGKTPEGWDKWIFGKIVHLADENAFGDEDFTSDFANSYSKFENGKIHAVLDFYKNVDLPEGEREFICQSKSEPIIYAPSNKKYDIDLTDSLTDTWLYPNVWGEEKSKYQDMGFNVSAKLNEHPRKGDTLNFTWKGKSESDIKNLYMMIADVEFFEDGHTNWTAIASDEEKFQLVASNVKAGDNLELKSTYTLNADSDHALQLHFCCGEDDATESVHLYSDKFVLPNPDITLKGHTLGSVLDRATVADNVITWKKGYEFGNCGWELSGVNLSEFDRVRVEIESTEAPIWISLYDKDWRNCHSFFTPVEENVWEVDLSGADAGWMEDNGSSFDKSEGLKIVIVSHVGDGNIRETDQITVVKKVELLKNHISLNNVSNGIEVTLTRKNSDPEWKYSVINITENGQPIGCSYSYFQNDKCVLNAEKNTLTLLFPFTTKGATYSFMINPYDQYTETVSIVAENDSEVKLQNLSTLDNFEVIYEEQDDEFGVKRIVKVTESPFEIFTNPSVIKYQQLCVNAYTIDSNNSRKWIYNFGSNKEQEIQLLDEGLAFIGNDNPYIFWKSEEELKNAFNAGEKIQFSSHFQFNTEPYSETSGNFIITLGSVTFDWEKID